jgi:glycerol-3-phosphate dehydrogenase
MEYSDAYLVDNDARFVFGFIREALNHGGISANYIEALHSERDENGLWVTEAKDLLTGRSITIKSRVLLNTCGPFADRYNAKCHVETEHQHLFSKGIHLLVDRITEAKRVLTFFADDGRMFFTIPMGPKSCIGTTDTRVEKLPAKITDEDRDFVLDNINKRLKLDKPLTRKDIIAERCGVRPLVVEPNSTHGDEGDWTSLSRKHAVEINYKLRQISVFGGKLTDCLNVGDEVAEAVQTLGVKLPYAGMKWYGEPPDQIRDEFFHQARLMNLDQMTSPDSSEALTTRLWRRYGSSALHLLEDIRQDPEMAEVLIQGTEYIRCELHHAARREMITKLEDFLRRRSKVALVARTEDIKAAPGLKEACEILFGEKANEKMEEYFINQAK